MTESYQLTKKKWLTIHSESFDKFHNHLDNKLEISIITNFLYVWNILLTNNYFSKCDDSIAIRPKRNKFIYRNRVSPRLILFISSKPKISYSYSWTTIIFESYAFQIPACFFFIFLLLLSPICFVSTSQAITG